MSRKKKPLPILEGVTITDVAAEGKSLTRVDDMVVFVPFAVPGDVVDLQVRKKKHHYCEAEVVRFIKYSERRAEPVCQHFGICGGCKWQNLPYEDQLKAKQKQVHDQLTRIGKVDLPDFRPILGSEKIYEYRNKLEFSCSNKRWLTKEEVSSGVQLDHKNAIGFHITGAFDKIYPIEKCWLMDDLCNQIRNEIRNYALNNGISFFDVKEQTGLLRDIMIRNSSTGEWMVLVQFKFQEQGDEQRAHDLLQHIGDRFPQITSLLYVNNQKCNDTFSDQTIEVFKGKDHITEMMDKLQFKVAAKSFYQTNTQQAFHLYEVARQLAQLTGKELVYDLYTGTGTIANFVARHAQQVIGIEYVEDAIADAKANSKCNGIENTLFYAGDMKDILTDEFVKQHGKPDVIITDPPRAGMHPDVIQTILRAAPKRIVYVSCNPATQARDLEVLNEQYRVEEVQPVDMFPHTPHVENVVLLEQR
ncbi:23S rRNA (uracil(1939)-C(5))-methyltransferase RlmD [Hoylesella timonensis]|uniref:23S rRNA (Uracil-5-)-methyltransferase RumA n=1 Tax=Hoylesella timonensis CRIS 5C-B1 TaxID=679189 RepID=D1VYA5_9BACT|nr:23S rRNA (uracil(1939)-C(5))-methyltransferase RlmD [Hoylesella timonensis]EFA97908.1 23S rRNA (uracil-5-)-methyltransferase RumA [Hoylesella timonensis CRIS 5C-B1]